ncbi:MAG: serine/threonine protein phosphatase [Oscillospiraceae bacterium]
MKAFNKKKYKSSVKTAERVKDDEIFRLAPTRTALEEGIYDSLRKEIPILDACITKIIRLVGDFQITAENFGAQKILDSFLTDVPVNCSGCSIHTFMDMYLDSLLVYGKSLGEIIPDKEKRTIKKLYVADSSLFRVRSGDNDTILIEPLFKNDDVMQFDEENLLYSTINPTPKHPDGVSVLRGIPALSDILKRIYQSIGQNFDRVGNVRYAITYNPSDESDKAFAKEHAMEIAKEWAEGMNSARNGCVKDFVAVGDVDIKVIGADNQIIDTEVPVRQILEQIISKLSIPPFLLGLNWSTTERMSAQQADILTSELEYFRRVLTPVLRKIAITYLRLQGFACDVSVDWAAINLQDEESLARARLYNAQAEQLELENAKQKGGNL